MAAHRPPLSRALASPIRLETLQGELAALKASLRAGERTGPGQIATGLGHDASTHTAAHGRAVSLVPDGRNAPVPERTSHTSPEPNRPSSADSDSPVLVSVARGIAEAEKVLAMPSPQRQPNAEPRLTTLKSVSQSSSDCRVPSSGSRFHLPRPLSPDPNCLVSGDSATSPENTLQAPPSKGDFSHPPCPQCRQQEAKICSLELQLSREKGLHAETDKALKEAIYNRLVDQGKLEAVLAENASLMRRLRCAEKTGHEKDTIFNELKTRAHNLETHLQASRIKVQNLEQKEMHWSSEEAKLRHALRTIMADMEELDAEKRQEMKTSRDHARQALNAKAALQQVVQHSLAGPSEITAQSECNEFEWRIARAQDRHQRIMHILA